MNFCLLSLENLLLKASIPILFNKENYGLNLTEPAVMIVTPGYFVLEVEKAGFLGKLLVLPCFPPLNTGGT